MKAILAVLIWAMVCFAEASAQQSILGTFSRIQIAVDEISTSMAWYVRMGFMPTKCSMDVPDSVMTLSDGQVILTLVRASVPSPVIVFSSNNVKALYDSLLGMSIRVNADIQGPTYRDLRFTSPEGIYVLVRPEADERVVPKPAGTPNATCGELTELSLGMLRVQRERDWWVGLGFAVKREGVDPYQFCLVSDGQIVLGMHHERDIPRLAFTYFDEAMTDRIETLRKVGVLPTEEIPNEMGVISNGIFRSPDGHSLMLFEGRQ